MHDMPDGFAANLLAAVAVSLTDRLTAATEEASGLGSSAAAALIVLRWHGAEPTEALGLRIGLSQPGTAQLVHRLEDQGLVRRRRGTDGRQRLLSLTPKGRTRADRILQRRREAMESAMAGLDAAQREALTAAAAAMLGRITPELPLADLLCRFCDEASCPDDACPVELALRGGGHAA